MHHSTDLMRLAKTCDYGYLHPSVNRDIFTPGKVAHAVIEKVTENPPADDAELRTVANAVAERMIREGSSFDGVPEPPLPIEPALDGRDVAINWLRFNGIPGGTPEVGLAVNKNLEPVEYLGESAYYGAIIDNVEFGEDGDEEMVYDVVTATDYKSAWPTDASELDTLQRKGQALVLYAHYKDRVQVIRQRVINLRTSGVFDRDIYLDEIGVDMLNEWWVDISIACRKADHVLAHADQVIARPGIACAGCPLAAGECPDAWKAVTDHEEQMSRYAAAQSVVDALKPILRAQTRDYTIEAGVGYKERTKKRLKHEALEMLALQWAKEGNSPIDPSEIKALLMAADPGVTVVKNLAKRMFPSRAMAQDRAAFLETVLEDFTASEFGVWK